MIETLTSSPLFLILLFPVGTLTIFVIGLIRVDIRDLRGKETAGQKLALEEAQRCLNCDMQTVFEDDLCIECDACVDICPMDCISFVKNADEEDLRKSLTAPAMDESQDLYVSDELRTKRVMVKDEDVCLHCGLCAERCPTNAWDMQRSVVHVPQLGSYKA